ncbi:uroporphyrinogen-III synthase [Pseudoalteromonas sp. MMG010]|uniref:uroporphyrinogen-III synthase n=1 Tax=Pseudoalteromonas sp. MMG010 TaxID=2822685 RepID=UPI001B3A5F81|nr:uroporphyrinogen-III synthase [Pseudoalteromonas sp. MMG010]MBQ4834105.1 uroporphyrinogen-III synthase [Pseudoalteromonas sp. MMG010]
MTHILITRPEGKGIALAQQLEQAGYQATLFPVLTLTHLSVSSSELSVLINADKIIFISQDAVAALAKLKPDMNTNAQFYAVGQQTADAIYEHFGIKATLPKQFDSEGLLALKSLNSVEQTNVVLVKGQKGRPEIGKVLKRRGAFLNNLIVYKRQAIESENTNWTDLWKSEQVDGIVITSNAAVDAIFDNVSMAQRQWLASCQFYVASERISAFLQQQNISSANIFVAAGASDNAMFNCIKAQGCNMNDKHNTPKINTPVTATTKADTTRSPTSSSAPQTEKTVPNKKSPKANNMTESKNQKVSKVATLALLISLIVASGVGFEFYQKLQAGKTQNLVLNNLSETNQQLAQEVTELKAAQIKLQRALSESEQNVTQALNENSLHTQQQLSAALQQAKQLDSALNPQEVNSLQRMAEFKLWAEKDYQGASAVLKRLTSLLNEYPGTVELRQAISQDIQLLDAIAAVPVEAIYFELNSVQKNIDRLVFNAVNLPKEATLEDETALSEDIADWQQNLDNSWQKILDSFLTIRHHEGEVVAPLLTDQQRHLISQRIKLYITQAQDALMSKQASIYFNAIDQTKRLVAEYFKKDDNTTQAVIKSLDALSQEPLNFNPQVTLQSTEQVKEWMK